MRFMADNAIISGENRILCKIAVQQIKSLKVWYLLQKRGILGIPIYFWRGYAMQSFYLLLLTYFQAESLSPWYTSSVVYCIFFGTE